MAIASVASRGTAASSSSGTTLALTPSATLAVGTVQILTIAKDNTGTVDNTDNSEVTSVTDNATSTKNVWRKLAEYTDSPTGAAADGVTVSIWACHIATAITTSNAITANFATCTDKASSLWEFTTAGGNSLVKDTGFTNPVNNETLASTGFGSVSFSSLTSAARLYFRGLGKEANIGTSGFTATTNFTAITMLRSRNNASAIGVCGEFRVNTSTGETSNPTLAVTGDTAGIFLALIEGPEQIKVTDSMKAGISDAQPSLGQFTKATTDSLKVGLAEPTTENVVSSGESLAVQISSTTPTVSTGGSSVTPVSASDSLKVQIGDVPTVTLSHAGETLKAGLSDTARVVNATLSASETMAPHLTDAARVISTTLHSAETLPAGLTEAARVVSVTVHTTDTLTARLSDAARVISVTLHPAETLSVSLTESPSVNAGGTVTKSTSDSLAVHLVEPSTETVSGPAESLKVQISSATPSISAGGVTTKSASDSLQVQVSELTTTQVSKGGDGLTVQISESASLLKVLTASDTLKVQVSETTSRFLSKSTSETIAPQLSSNVTLVAGGTTSKTAHESASVQITEAAAIRVTFSVADSLKTGLTESSLIHSTLAVTETCSPQVSDVNRLIVSVHASETLAVTATDNQGGAQALFASDSCTLHASEAATVVNVSSGFITKTAHDLVGVGMAEASSSVRTGSLTGPNVAAGTARYSKHAHVRSYRIRDSKQW